MVRQPLVAGPSSVPGLDRLPVALTGGRASGADAPPEAYAAVAAAEPAPLWLDSPLRPAPRPALGGPATADLVVVGAGFTGLWAAVQAAERHPGRDVLLLEGDRLAGAASGRNGGFVEASLTHGTANGRARWPEELPQLERLGSENLRGIEEALARHGVATRDVGWERTGSLTVATSPWQLRELAADPGLAPGDLLDGDAVRALVDSPTYLGGVRDADGCALVDPARLAWALAAVAERLGIRVHERTPVTGLARDGGGVAVTTAYGVVRARQVLLATNAFPSLLRRVRPYVVPVWDYVLATAPLPPDVRASLRWAGREGVSDAGNQFHYYRLTPDDRLLWGGYDAVYYYGSGMERRHEHSTQTYARLLTHLWETFPQLRDVPVTHRWGGAIDTCTRFTAFWGTALRGRVAYVLGYTGLGVGASRFGAGVALELLDGADTERTRLDMVRHRPVPFPPEPLRWAGITRTRRSLARADARDGERDLWLRTLDRLGLGFDS